MFVIAQTTDLFDESRQKIYKYTKKKKKMERKIVCNGRDNINILIFNIDIQSFQQKLRKLYSKCNNIRILNHKKIVSTYLFCTQHFKFTAIQTAVGIFLFFFFVFFFYHRWEIKLLSVEFSLNQEMDIMVDCRLNLLLNIIQTHLIDINQNVFCLMENFYVISI